MVSFGLLRRVALVRTDVSEERSVRRLLVVACVVPSSPIFVTLMKEAPASADTSVITRATWRNNPEYTILLSPECFKPGKQEDANLQEANHYITELSSRTLKSCM
jgi:hypothetical protein